MADLLAANVTMVKSWTTGGTTGKRNKVRQVKWTGTTAGGATNRLLATALGFTKIIRASNILLDSSTKKIYSTVPSSDGLVLYVSAPTDATDATRANVADLATSTDYAYCTIEGL
jgi:hypothetical protein